MTHTPSTPGARQAKAEIPEHCESCGYTEQDAQIHGDHSRCKNAGKAPWELRKKSNVLLPCKDCKQRLGNNGLPVYYFSTASDDGSVYPAHIRCEQCGLCVHGGVTEESVTNKWNRAMALPASLPAEGPELTLVVCGQCSNTTDDVKQDGSYRCGHCGAVGIAKFSSALPAEGVALPPEAARWERKVDGVGSFMALTANGEFVRWCDYDDLRKAADAALSESAALRKQLEESSELLREANRGVVRRSDYEEMRLRAETAEAKLKEAGDGE